MFQWMQHRAGHAAIAAVGAVVVRSHRLAAVGAGEAIEARGAAPVPQPGVAQSLVRGEPVAGPHLQKPSSCYSYTIQVYASGPFTVPRIWHPCMT